MAGLHLEAGGVRWRLRDPCGAEHLAPQLARILEELEAGRVANLRSGRRKELYEVRLDGGTRPTHLLKVNRYPPGAGFVRRLRGSKAMRELRLATAVARRGVPTPVPLACGERIAGGRLQACYVLVPRLEHAVDLGTLAQGRPPPAAQRRAIARAFGALARRVHDAGVFQDDFAPNNFLVVRGPEPELFMIDFERVRLRRGALGEGERRHTLAKLERRLSHVGRSDRMRFLLAYSRGERPTAREWWREIAAYMPRLARSDLARLRRSTTRDGRRHRRVRERGVRGWARRDADLEASSRAGACPLRPRSGSWPVSYPSLSASRRRELWASANLLWMRGLGPKPLAMLWGGGETLLHLERLPGARRLAELEEPAQRRAALVRLVGHLLALGRLDPALTAREIVVHPTGPDTALGLLAPHRWSAREAPSTPARQRRNRQLAERILTASCA